MTVMLNEYASAVAGIVPHGAGMVLSVASVGDCTGIGVVVPGPRDGPAKGLTSPLNPAAAPRVSTRRQGVIATKVRLSGETVFVVCGSGDSGFAAASLSARLACQCRGVDQFVSGMFSCALCAVNMRGRKVRMDAARPGNLEEIT